MKNYKVRFNKGHLVDTETHKRVLLKRGNTFTIQGDDDSFESEDDLVKLKNKALDHQSKLEKLKSNFKNHQFIQIAKAGDFLAFNIGISRPTNEDSTPKYWFNAQLLEDLYLKKNLKKDKAIYNLAPCLVRSIDCFDGGINLYEEIYGFSLNNLFSNMVAFYFMLQRSGACNAFNAFYLIHRPAKDYNDFQKMRPTELEEIRKYYQQ